MSEENKEIRNDPKGDYVTLNKSTVWMIVSGILLILLVASIMTDGFNFKDKDTVEDKVDRVDPQPSQPKQPIQPAAPSIDMATLVDDDSVKGDPNAPVTIIEWSDFECPFCARFYGDAYQQIVTEYIDTGKVKLVFRDYPLNFHPEAQKAAEAAECSGEQGKYYEMHDKLFEDGVVGGITTFKKYASEIGLDAADFAECLDSGKMASEVAKDMADGQAAGVKGTPGFLINGELISGAQPFANFKAVIDRKLAE